jgi:hypothetical protein
MSMSTIHQLGIRLLVLIIVLFPLALMAMDSAPNPVPRSLLLENLRTMLIGCVVSAGARLCYPVCAFSAGLFCLFCLYVSILITGVHAVLFGFKA